PSVRSYSRMTSVTRRMMLVLSAPARPRSGVTRSTPTVLTGRWVSRGWSAPAPVGACAPSSATSARIASAYGRAEVTRICARRSRDAATSSMALVILAVFRIDLIRRRMSRSEGIGRLDNHLPLEFVDGRPQRGDGVVRERFLPGDRVDELGAGGLHEA